VKPPFDYFEQPALRILPDEQRQADHRHEVLHELKKLNAPGNLPAEQ
jgi:hypothetical protein